MGSRPSGTANGKGRPHLSFDQLRMTAILLPPIEEQRRILAEVDRGLAISDRIAADLDTQLARATRLRQSILKHAFEGKLVPQDPNDEPASVLLERIRAERNSPAESSSSRKPIANARAKSASRSRRR